MTYNFLALVLVVMTAVSAAAIVTGTITGNQAIESYGWAVIAITLLFAIIVSAFVLWSLVFGGTS